ncbi:MAG TPA: hypothetical protein VGK04_04705 [Thermoanaerobaculia bacterium]|jgi:predicted O-methyltransferase YrrM
MKDRVDAILQRKQAEYLETLTPRRDALLERMEKFAAENNHPIADPEVAQLLRVLVAGSVRDGSSKSEPTSATRSW